MSTDINYDNKCPFGNFGPIADTGLRVQLSRDRRRPVRFLTAVHASGAAVVPELACRHVENFVNCKNSQQSCKELLDYTDYNCVDTLSVDSDRRMPDKRQRKGKRRHRSDSSSDSETNCHGRRRPRQQQPRIPFEPHYWGQCAPADCRTRFATRSSLTKHTVLQHGTWYHPGRDEYVAIPEERLEAMRARYRAWQSHKTKSTRRRQPRSGCRAEATATRDQTLSLPPSAPGICSRISVEPEDPPVLPVTTTGDWRPLTSVLSTVRARLCAGTGIGRGYGVLRYAAERDPSPPTSRNRPPLSSMDSDDDLSDITVVDIGLETDATVVGFDRYSDVSEPGSPSASASLDQAASMASATWSTSTAAAEGTSADSIGMPPSLGLAGFIHSYKHLSGTSHTVMSEGSGPLCGVGPSVLGAVISPDGTHPPGPSATVDPATEDPVPGPEVSDPLDPSGQGLCATPEGTSSSLPCGQRVATPESDSSFEIISDTDSEKRPDRRTAPAFPEPGTLSGKTGVDLVRPPLRFDDLFVLVRSTPMESYGVAAANVRQEFQTIHDQDTLVALLMSMAAARVATATEIYQQAVQRVGDGQATPAAFLELVRYLDDVRHHPVRSD